MKFVVIGAGAGGQVMAAHLSLMGYAVSLYNRSEERIEIIKKRGTIKLTGAIKRSVRLNKVTTDIEEAIKNMDIIMVVVPAFAHKDVARTCGPYLEDGQVILLIPGRTFGAIEFAKTMSEQDVRADVIIAETQTVLHTCRVSMQGSVNIVAIKRKVPLAALPASRTQEVIKPLQGMFSQFVPANDVLETGLNNVGCILHPTPTLLNIGWIETKRTEFKYYYEGITSTVAQILELLDQERCSVAKALGVKTISTRQWLYEVYGAKGATLYEALQNNAYYRTIEAPNTINHRYLFEDIPTGLVPISSTGCLVGVDTPVTDQIIDLACSICKVDFRKEGRTVDNLRLACMSVSRIRQFVRTG